MTDQQDPRSKQYEQARRAFDDLEIEEKALFLVKEAVSTIAHSIEEVGTTLADEIDALFREFNGAEKADAEKDAPDVAEADAPKKTTRTRASAKKTTTSASAKKTTPKKTTTKKPTSKSSAKKGKSDDA